ncbi:MAG: hypothetical protein PVI82_04190 [Desulfobacterales bacterium]|jgi:hypothetical protein
MKNYFLKTFTYFFILVFISSGIVYAEQLYKSKKFPPDELIKKQEKRIVNIIGKYREQAYEYKVFYKYRENSKYKITYTTVYKLDSDVWLLNTFWGDLQLIMK